MKLILQAIKALLRKIESKHTLDIGSLSNQLAEVGAIANKAKEIAGSALTAADTAKAAVDYNFYYTSISKIIFVDSLAVGATVTSQLKENQYKLRHADTTSYLDVAELVSAINGHNGKIVKIEIALVDSARITSWVNVCNAYVVNDGTYNYTMHGLVVSGAKVFTVAIVCADDTATLSITRVL